jgi:hypothetical protein
MRNKIIAHFHLKRSNPETTKEAIIYLRLTVNGERTEISTDKKIDPAKWNLITQRVNDRNGRSEIAKVINPLQKPDNLTTFRRSKLTTSELVH